MGVLERDERKKEPVRVWKSQSGGDEEDDGGGALLARILENLKNKNTN